MFFAKSCARAKLCRRSDGGSVVILHSLGALKAPRRRRRTHDASKMEREHVGISDFAIRDRRDEAADTARKHREAEKDANHAVAARGGTK